VRQRNSRSAAEQSADHAGKADVIPPMASRVLVDFACWPAFVRPVHEFIQQRHLALPFVATPGEIGLAVPTDFIDHRAGTARCTRVTAPFGWVPAWIRRR
jgi:hypothetical protein